MMLRSIQKKIETELSKKQVVDYEIYFEKKKCRGFISKDLKLETAEESVQVGLGLRVFKDKKFSFVYSTDLSDPGLEKLCESAVHILPLVDADSDYGLPAPPAISMPINLKTFDSKLSDIPANQKLGLAMEMEKAAKDIDPKIRNVRSASYDEEIKEVELINSRGLECYHQKTACSLSVMAVAEDKGEAESAYEFGFSPFFEELNPEKVGKDAGRLALSYLGAVTPPSGRLPVVLDPLVSGEFLVALARSFRGDEVLKKRSFLAGQLEKTIYSDSITILDDQTLSGGWNSTTFDGEGYPSRCLTLVKEGKLQSYLLDTFYGKKLGPGGNGSSIRHGIRRPPEISYSNLLIPPGSLSDEEIFRDIGNGILVTEVIGMHATDEITGDFSVGAQGFKIENGEKTVPVKKMAIAGNLHQIMAKVLKVGSRHRFYFNIGAPTLAFAGITVSGE